MTIKTIVSSSFVDFLNTIYPIWVMRITRNILYVIWFYILAQKESEKVNIFCKIEPCLTFLNVHQQQRQGADIQTKVEE